VQRPDFGVGRADGPRRTLRRRLRHSVITDPIGTWPWSLDKEGLCDIDNRTIRIDEPAGVEPAITCKIGKGIGVRLTVSVEQHSVNTVNTRKEQIRKAA